MRPAVKGGRAERRAAEVRARRAARGDAPQGSAFMPPWPLLLSFAGILFLWVFFEISRFGKLGGGYGNETFAYPFLTGLLRLTVLPNKGLFWYAPLTLLAVPGFFLLRRRDARLALALAASAAALLFASSAWWAWDGQAGWGPRLVLPSLPCLVALAGVASAFGGRAWRITGVIAALAGAGVNAVGALVPFPGRVCAVLPGSAPAHLGGARGRDAVRDRARRGRHPPRDGPASSLPHAGLVSDPRPRARPRGAAARRLRRDAAAARPAVPRRAPGVARARPAPRASRRSGSDGEGSSSKERETSDREKRPGPTPTSTRCGTSSSGRST